MIITAAAQDPVIAETPSDLLASLPQGSIIQEIAFVSERPDEQATVLAFPHTIQRWAVLTKNANNPQKKSAFELAVLSIPAQNQDSNPEADNQLLATMQNWVDSLATPETPASLVMTLQGARILWTHGRMAILAHPDRLKTIRLALIEVSFYEAELREIERTLGEAWPQLEADIPLAFEFAENAIKKRKSLRQRFQEVLLIQARLARLGPFVHCPHLHPPTLASQIGERLRERTRMVYRHEFLGSQLDIFERVYEGCGQRASDFMLTRSGNTLEWIIIVLLLTQLLLSGFEILTTVGQSGL